MEYNYLDVFNEICVMIIAYSTIPYSDYLIAPRFKYQIGWGVMVLAGLNLAGNVLFIIGCSLWGIIKKVRDKIRKKKQQKKASKYAKEENLGKNEREDS